MTAIARTFPTHLSRADRRSSHSVWRDTMIGLAGVLAVITMTVLATIDRPDTKYNGVWPTAEHASSPQAPGWRMPTVPFPTSPNVG